MPEYSGMRNSTADNRNQSESPDLRRYEIQKANIYASHLATRSHLVEKYFLQLEKYQRMKAKGGLQPSTNPIVAGIDKFVSDTTTVADALEKAMSEEREQVVKDLLVVLGSIDMVNMEPNGDSFVSLHVYWQVFDLKLMRGPNTDTKNSIHRKHIARSTQGEKRQRGTTASRLPLQVLRYIK